MSTRYGTNSKRIGAADIYNTIPSNMTITSEGEDVTGGYYVTAYVNTNAPGCGGLQPSLAVNIKNDALLGWKKISFKTYGTFTAACWYLNNAWPNNIHDYSPSAGDRIFKSKNCFELPQFTVQVAACDNNSNNAFHTTYAVGTFREWYQTRRRNDLNAIAGPMVMLSCNSVGTGATIRFSDIFVSV